MIRQQSCVEQVETFIVITCVCIINLQFKRQMTLSGYVINQFSANLCYLSQDRMENCGIVFVYHLYYAYLCGAWVGTNRSLYMVQFRATNLLENLLDFHLEGVLLLQIEKCSMSSSIVAWEEWPLLEQSWTSRLKSRMSNDISARSNTISTVINIGSSALQLNASFAAVYTSP